MYYYTVLITEVWKSLPKCTDFNVKFQQLFPPLPETLYYGELQRLSTAQPQCGLSGFASAYKSWLYRIQDGNNVVAVL